MIRFVKIKIKRSKMKEGKASKNVPRVEGGEWR